MKQNIKFRIMFMSFIVLAVTFLTLDCPMEVKAEINEEVSEEMPAQTAYVDMSKVSPLSLHFTEDQMDQKPDYYYAAQAYQILLERIELDPMYRNCDEVIVTINRAYSSTDVMLTTYEPQAQTGYLNLLSKETNKCYTIDDVVIHIQREK